MWKASETDLKNWQENRDGYEPQFKPKFHFVNCVETISHDADRVVVKNNKYNQQVVSFNMIFTEEFEIENFPFDVQDMSLVLKEARNLRELAHDKPPDELFNNYIMFDRTWSSITDWTILGADLSIIPEKFVSRYKG